MGTRAILETSCLPQCRFLLSSSNLRSSLLMISHNLILIEQVDPMIKVCHIRSLNLINLCFLNCLILHHTSSVNSIHSQFYLFRKMQQTPCTLKEFLWMPLSERLRISLDLSWASKLFVLFLVKRNPEKRSSFVLLILNRLCKPLLLSTPSKDIGLIGTIFLGCSSLTRSQTTKTTTISQLKAAPSSRTCKAKGFLLYNKMQLLSKTP